MPHSRVEAHHFEALGTSCSLFAVGASRRALLEAEFSIRRLGSRLTRFSPGSELSHLNASAGRWQDVSPEVESLLRESMRAYETSFGLVNVAVLRSMEAAGYTRPLSEGRPVATELRACPLPALPDVLAVRPGAARLETGAGVDLGGIAKGWMADRVVDFLGPNALVNLGGDLRAAGSGPSGTGWPVASVARRCFCATRVRRPAACASAVGVASITTSSIRGRGSPRAPASKRSRSSRRVGRRLRSWPRPPCWSGRSWRLPTARPMPSRGG
jgi:thiamine biosynthesis lipoprotein ApbE